MRDGAIGLRFVPQLTPEQYIRLLKVTNPCNTRDDLLAAAKQLAIEWLANLEVEERRVST